jgi:HlyD family secretion protein
MTTNSTPTGQSIGLAETLLLQKKSTRNRRLKQWLAWFVAVVLVAVGGVFWVLRDTSGPIRYRTQPVHHGDITITVSATGNLQPTNQVVMGSELSGTVKSVEVDYNDQVSVGQVLARLDTSKLSAQVRQSRAAVDSAHAKVLQAEATIKETTAAFDRLVEVGRLSNNKASSEKDLDTTRAALDRAKADHAGALASVAQAEATLALNLTDLAKTEIRSPINGLVLTRSVEPGQTVAASLQAPVLFTLAENLAQMELHVDVDEADVGKVQAGQEATFTVDAYPDRKYPAEITQIRYGAKTTSGVVTYETILKVDNGDLSLRPGMTATADITVTKVAGALLVPNAALRFVPKGIEGGPGGKGGGTVLSKLMPHPPQRMGGKRKEASGGRKGGTQRVWVLVDGQPSPVQVTTGLTDGSATQITNGDLQPGAELITGEETIKK